MLKRIFAILSMFICMTSVSADNSIKFTDKEFEEYFTSKHYKVEQTECLNTTDYDLKCTMFIAYNAQTNYEIDLYEFDDEQSSYDYFKYIYEDNLERFSNIELYNFNQDEKSNYSYIRTELSEMYYFYLVKIDKYILKTNIDKEKRNVMDEIFSELGFMENPNPENKIENNSIYTLLALIILFVIIVGIIFLIKKKKEKIFSIIRKNKFKIFIGLLVLIISIISTVIILSYHTKINLKDEEKFKIEYETLNGKVAEKGRKYPNVVITVPNKIKYFNIDEVISIFEEKKSGVIYLGYPECILCRRAVEVLIEVSNDTEIENIYYLNTKDIKDNSNYSKLISIIGEDFIEKPMVMFIVNGEMKFSNIGTIYSQEDPYSSLDETQKEGLKEIYLYGIKEVLK